jgi:DNA (cytosine-5)-methyltransferase 1
MKAEHLFPFRWRLSDGYPAAGIPAHGRKVFGTFICGGGSSMGYKLAGFHHLGGVEIDPKVAAIYEQNHHPELLFTEDLRLFNQRTDLPDVLYDLDVLDGSPPCTTFSMAGQRERTWGKEKVFAEGQALQTLDDLVFVYCETIMKLRPKVFLLENVRGLAAGNAKSYLKRIFTTLSSAGYACQVFLLNAATMGVPQIRERCFVIGHRKEFDLPKLILDFKEQPILFSQVIDKEDTRQTLPPAAMEAFHAWKPCDGRLYDTNIRVFGRPSGFTTPWAPNDKVCRTLTTGTCYLTAIPRELNDKELIQVATFPEDYAYPNHNRLRWLTGMSVPPVMIAQIANQINLQWLNTIS